jgi:carboxyl-terminal processing protease
MKTMLNVTVKPADIDPVTVFDLGVTDGVLHLYLKKFYPGLASDTEALIARAVQKQGIKGVVLDLRNNGGGLTDEALKIADLFLPKGTLLYEMAGRAEGVKQVRTDAIPRYATLGLSIITNGNSASASEIIAGAFQAHNRATIVGWKSLGKGTVQRVFPVESGAITITFAEYRDGGLRKINGVGVMPDVLMDAPDPRMRPSRFDKDTARDSAIVYALKKHEDLSSNSKFNVDVDEKP